MKNISICGLFFSIVCFLISLGLNELVATSSLKGNLLGAGILALAGFFAMTGFIALILLVAIWKTGPR